MAIVAGAIERAVVHEIVDEPDEPGLDGLGEIEQQFQIAVTGTAESTIAWTDVDLTFDAEFPAGEFQRYSNLTEPQIMFGSLIDSADPVVVVGCVRSWYTDDRGVIVGATVAIGAYDPGGGGVAFSGSAHFTFEGFGSVPNEPADPDFTP